jgi:hypothetical protein
MSRKRAIEDITKWISNNLNSIEIESSIADYSATNLSWHLGLLANEINSLVQIINGEVLYFKPAINFSDESDLEGSLELMKQLYTWLISIYNNKVKAARAHKIASKVWSKTLEATEAEWSEWEEWKNKKSAPADYDYNAQKTIEDRKYEALSEKLKRSDERRYLVISTNENMVKFWEGAE